MNEVFSDTFGLTCMLSFEAALARAQATHGLIPRASANIVAGHCRDELVDLNLLGEQSAIAVNPAIPLVKQLISVVKKNRDAEAAKYVHFGATSQDVMDTELVLQIDEALRLIDADLQIIQNNLVELMEKHRYTVMAGRTLLQHVRPITFGFKAAVWLDGLSRSRKRLQGLRLNTLVIQFGGAVGTLASRTVRGSKWYVRWQKNLACKRHRVAGIPFAIESRILLPASVFLWATWERWRMTSSC